MKVAVSGSRGFTDWSVVEAVVDRLIQAGDHILVGDARGWDRMVAEYVTYREDDVYDWDVYLAEWERYGKRAGHLRNEWMIHDADALVAVFAPGPRSPGTQNAIQHALRRGIPFVVYEDGAWAQ